MRKRLLSALLAMAMMLTMLPTAAFAAEGDEKVAPEVEAYGFVWEAQQPEADLGSGYKAGSDWMGETMWVALKEGSTVGQNLWFEVTVDSDVWGCAATTSDKNMFAFSFLNRTTQWEQAPQNITVGEGQAHAEKYLADKNVAKATLRVYVTESLFSSQSHTLPQDATPIFEKEVVITKGQNTLVKVPSADEAAIGELKFFADGAKANDVLNKTDSERATMIVPFSGLAQDTTYALTLVYPDGIHTMSGNAIPINGEEEELIANPVATAEKNAGSYYFSLNAWEGSNNTEYLGLGAGEYTVNLYTVTGEEGSKQYTKVDSKTITLAEVTVDFGEGKVANDLINQHEDKGQDHFFEIDTDANKVTFFVNAADIATVENAAETLNKFITVKETLTGGVWSYDSAAKTFTYGEAPVTYAITAATGIANGTVTVPATAAEGAKVEFTVKPDANYEIDTVTVVKTEPAQGEDTPASQADEPIKVTPGEEATDGTVTYSFEMPAYAVTVNATFKAKTTDPEEPAERTEKIASTGFEAVAADADEALGVESAPEAAAHCDPNTMWAKFEGLNAEKNYRLVVTKGGAEVYTEASFPGTATKVYFTLDPELVESKPDGHSIAKSAIAEGKYEFTLTEVVADAPAGQAETEEKPLEAKAELEICKVTFNANGATSGTAPAAIFASQNNDIALPDRGDLVKTGYAFTGWGVALNEDGKYVVKDTIELKAQWLNDNVTHVDAEVTTGTLEPTVADEVKKTTVDSSAMLTDPAVLAETDKLAEQIPQDTTDILTDEQKTEGGFVLKVAVYMEVAAKEYTPASDTNPNPVLKLEITPKSKLVAVKSVQGQPDKIEDVAEGKANAKPLPVTEFVNPVTINVVLPAGFATAGDNDIFAKHMGTTVQYIETTVTNGVDTLAGSVIATFEANEFSPYELTKDARKVAVTFKDAEGNVITEIGAAGVLNLSPVNISEDLPTVTAPDGYEFKGWAVAADKTKVVYNGKLTEEYLTEMSKTATLELFAVVTKSSGGSTGPAPGGIGGGSSGTTTYSVNVPTVSNGTVTVNPRNAAKDATVTITVSPNQGYHLESLTVTDKDGNTIELTKVDATKYTFKMPASRVEVKAVFAEGEAPAVSFTDVAEGEYYYDAVKWAVDKGVTNGLTETTFGPNASCTRAQMVTFLWRAAGSPEPTATTTAFTDIDANEYYYKAVLWAVEKGITTGTTETTFSPNATVTRAQTVTFLYRYAGSPAVSGSNNFTDLEAGEYYINAVQWAATNGITTGTTETTFSPANNCTRGQIVTFLYRHIVK